MVWSEASLRKHGKMKPFEHTVGFVDAETGAEGAAGEMQVSVLEAPLSLLIKSIMYR